MSPVVTAGVNVVLDPVNLRVKGVCRRQQAFHYEIIQQSRFSSTMQDSRFPYNVLAKKVLDAWCPSRSANPHNCAQQSPHHVHSRIHLGHRDPSRKYTWVTIVGGRWEQVTLNLSLPNRRSGCNFFLPHGKSPVFTAPHQCTHVRDHLICFLKQGNFVPLACGLPYSNCGR